MTKQRPITQATPPATPKARPGVPMHVTTMVIVSGPRRLFYWYATEQPGEMTPQEVIETQQLHGPFDTEVAADEAARVAVLGTDCEVAEGGMWDRAWDRKQ